jgi:hypothetical protein
MELSTTTERYLVAMVTWVRQRVLYGIKVNPDNFTLEVAQEEAMKLTMRDEAINQSKDYKPPMPEKFKAASKYKVFKETVQNYLNQLTGISDVPLSYVIRDESQRDLNAKYETETARLIAIALLSGNAFEKDNQKLYAILKNLYLEGEARTYIKVPQIESLQDGRAL